MSVVIDHSARNQANAQHSTGPKTPEGKSRSSKNAIKHGLFCKELLLPGEDPETLRQFKNEVLRSLNPRDMLQLQLAEQIIADQWRIKRLRAAEREMFETHTKRTQRGSGPRQEVAELLKKFPNMPEMAKGENASTSVRRYQRLMREISQSPEEPAPPPPTASQIMAQMLESDDPALERLHRYERRLECSINRCINQLRKLKQEEPEPVNQFTQALLDEEDGNQEQIVQNEAKEAKDDAPNPPSSPSLHPLPGADTIPGGGRNDKTNPDLNGESDASTQ